MDLTGRFTYDAGAKRLRFEFDGDVDRSMNVLRIKPETDIEAGSTSDEGYWCHDMPEICMLVVGEGDDKGKVGVINDNTPTAELKAFVEYIDDVLPIELDDKGQKKTKPPFIYGHPNLTWDEYHDIKAQS